MFGKKKTEKKVEPENKIAKPKMEPYEIHVMPPKFHKHLGTKKGLSFGKLAIILGISLLVLAGITVGIYFFISQMNQQPQPPSPPTINLPQPDINENTNINEPVDNINIEPDENINVEIDENLNINENENINENTNSNTNGNINTNLNIAPPEVNYSSSLDSDKDGLTDIEEEIYKTERNLPDTDADGFIDGQELINGYNPKAAGSSSLATSGLVNKYSNPVFNYEILHPSAWLDRPTDQSLKEVIFQSATGEYIQIIVEDNIGSVDIVEWYIEQSPLSQLGQLERETLASGYEVLISPDKLTYYLVDKQNPELVYVITYTIGTKTRINFLTTFQMMINSFNLIGSSQPLPVPVDNGELSEENIELPLGEE
jgi:hypothetical protein